MAPLTDLLIVVRRTLAEWLRVEWNDLHFSAADTTLLVLIVLLATAALMVVVRSRRWSRVPRAAVGVPAILPVIRRSPMSGLRHAPFLLFLLGLPFFAVALADPLTAFTREEVTYPGRRIALVVDGSNSMILPFATSELKTSSNRAFFTAVASAERFMRLRMNGPYRDLIALIQFGTYAYVVTPFTTDYENVLLSIRLISDPVNWARFGDGGTTILEGIAEGAKLFKAFDFINASGNLMVIFSDGIDDRLHLEGKSIEQLVATARQSAIPVYMIRTAYDRKFGEVRQDRLWQPAIERTGGRFYPASDEATILRAVQDIDRVSAGRIDVREYTAYQPRFSGYALVAVALWLSAAVLKLGFRTFRTFP
ncbi:MAG TPA: vWA domain-containing protein [Vicinamibacterales bacterium]